MAYQNNIPLATDQLSQSQQDINGNFQAIGTVVAVNHVAFNQSGQGKHLFVEFPTGAPSGTTQPGPEVALYSNNGVVSGVPELFFQRNNLGAGLGKPATEKGSETISGNVVNFTYLPSGVILKYGKSATGGGGTKAIFLNSGTVGGPNYASDFQVFVVFNATNNGFPSGNLYVAEAYNVSNIAFSFSVATYQNGSLTGSLPFSYYAIGI